MKNTNFCPCCNYLTMPEDFPGSFAICPICYWEDDLLQFHNPNLSGGANNVSLIKARENFLKFKVSDINFVNNVREPQENEINKT